MANAQGIKPSDNLVLRAALRLMPRDHRLIEQIECYSREMAGVYDTATKLPNKILPY
jgi:hypothetical protein